jgi:signal transduction histidine kinase
LSYGFPTASAAPTAKFNRKIAEHKTTLREGELARTGRFALADELSASIAHEVAQPLGAILGNADAVGILLGLSIVRTIVVADGGNVSAADRDDGGSVFTGWLPATASNNASRAQPELEKPAENATFKSRSATQ